MLLSIHPGELFYPVGKQNANGALGEDKVFLSQDAVWSVDLASRCSLADAIAHMSFNQCIVLEVLDI